MRNFRLASAAVALLATWPFAAAEHKIVVSAVYVGPLEQKWNSVLRAALRAAAKAKVASVREDILAGRFVVKINDEVPSSTY